MTTTPSSPPLDRGELLADLSLRGGQFTDAHTTLIDAWLERLFHSVFADRSDIALVATGGHGRRDLSPHSDLDLLLLHEGTVDAATAQQFWYPIWDSGFKLGHAVRSTGETISLAKDDLATATSLLSARHLSGSSAHTNTLIAQAQTMWTKGRQRWLVALAESVERRHEAAIDVAYALEPDLKEGRGGLRDFHAIEWSLASGGIETDLDLVQLRQQYEILLATRVELHRVIGRAGDKLHLQVQDDVARRLDDPNADELMSRIAIAARGIAWASDEHWHDLKRTLTHSNRRFKRTEKAVDLGHGVSMADGRIALHPDAPEDQFAVLRVAVGAATSGARISRATLEQLASAPTLSEPWAPQALQLFVQLLACGQAGVPVIETLDEANLWCRLIPEWEPNRCKPQRNAYHRFTVDRHLLEAVARAGERVGVVNRPDLLLIGALLHDIGKGYDGDHTDVGMVLAETIARRMGLDDDDRATIVMMVEHHLLLPDIATRRDLDDPATIRWVAAQSGTVERLHLLAALTEADSIATGPAAWGPWKAGLVRQLVERAARVLAGGDASELAVSPQRLSEQRELMNRARALEEPVMVINGNELTVACRDRPAVFSRIAGVLAMCGLDVTEASAFGEDDMVLDRFRVTPSLGTEVAWPKVQRSLIQALCGRLALDSRLAERARTYRKPVAAAHSLQPKVRVLNEASDDATVIEVTGPDSVGLLYRLTRALAELDLEIVGAKAATMGHDVVDAFYVRERNGAKVTDAADVAEIETALLHALTVG